MGACCLCACVFKIALVILNTAILVRLRHCKNSTHWRSLYSFIHSRIYMSPLQEIYSEASPAAQPRRYRSVLSNLLNALSLFLCRIRISIPGGGTNNGECTRLPSCSFSTRHQ